MDLDLSDVSRIFSRIELQDNMTQGQNVPREHPTPVVFTRRTTTEPPRDALIPLRELSHSLPSTSRSGGSRTPNVEHAPRERPLDTTPRNNTERQPRGSDRNFSQGSGTPKELIYNVTVKASREFNSVGSSGGCSVCALRAKSGCGATALPVIASNDPLMLKWKRVLDTIGTCLKSLFDSVAGVKESEHPDVKFLKSVLRRDMFQAALSESYRRESMEPTVYRITEESGKFTDLSLILGTGGLRAQLNKALGYICQLWNYNYRQWEGFAKRSELTAPRLMEMILTQRTVISAPYYYTRTTIREIEAIIGGHVTLDADQLDQVRDLLKNGANLLQSESDNLVIKLCEGERLKEEVVKHADERAALYTTINHLRARR